MGDRPRSPGFIQSISKAQLKVVGLLDAAGAPVVGVDTTALHKATAAEISALTAKATPTTSDFLVIEDAAAANAKKRITIGDLPAAAAVGMTSVVSEITTTDATQTAFTTFVMAASSIYLCNVRIISTRNPAGGGAWASFQWLGFVVEDMDGDGVVVGTNGTSSAAPDFSKLTGSALRIAVATDGGAPTVKITANAGETWKHRMVLEYNVLQHS